MSEDTGQIAQPRSRSLVVTAVGDNMAGVEMDALDKAREFFGEGWRLRVDPDYTAMAVGPHSPHAPAGRRYVASVTISLVEPES